MQETASMETEEANRLIAELPEEELDDFIKFAFKVINRTKN